MASIYDNLVDHQRTEEWRLRTILEDLHRWRERFTDEFKLGSFECAIAVQRISHWRLGQYRRGHNGFGLKGEIILSHEHVMANLAADQWWRVLGTLLHELLHAWQEVYGRPGQPPYHNQQFRRRAQDLGLIVDASGHTQYDPDTPFMAMLGKHGVTVPQLELVAAQVRLSRGPQKLALWMCGCPVRIRVGQRQINVRCMDCNQFFERCTESTQQRSRKR